MGVKLQFTRARIKIIIGGQSFFTGEGEKMIEREGVNFAFQIILVLGDREVDCYFLY